MFEKRVLFKSQEKDLLQNLAKRQVYQSMVIILETNINEEKKCVTETRMREKFDDRVKEWFPLSNSNLIVKLEDNKVVDDYDKAKSVNTMP